MSDENEDLIEKTFVDSLGAKYPLVKVDASVGRDYAIKFYPSVYVIAPDGTVHSVPEDRMPNEATIESLLKNVSLAPRLPDDARYGPLRSMWEKKQYGKIGGYLDKMLAQENLDAEMRDVFQAQRDELQKRAERATAQAQQAGAGPDFLAGEQRLERLVDEWQGFPAADAAKAELERFKKDATIKKEIAASKALQKVVEKYDPSSLSQAKKLKADLEKFVKKYEGTYAAQQAQQKIGG